MSCISILPRILVSRAINPQAQVRGILFAEGPDFAGHRER
jgi:hypothetical protein